jgi:ribonuclease D
MDRQDWAREEFAKLTNAAAPEEPNNDKWRKLRGLGSLDRRRLAVVKALFEWREAQAAVSNRPARSLIRDDLLIEIAKRGPVLESDLQSMRGLSRRDLSAICDVVEQARTLPPEQWPALAGREQDPPQVTLLANILGSVLADLCLRRQLASNLVANSSDVKALVRGRLVDPTSAAESQLTRGWRARYLLPELQDLLEGRTTLRIADAGGETPLEYGQYRPDTLS